MNIYDIYCCLTTCTANNGDTIMLWKDKWCGQSLMDKFPQLHSFVDDDNISILKAKTVDNYYSMFQLPLPNIAFQQFTQLSNTLEHIKNKQERVNGISNGVDPITTQKSLQCPYGTIWTSSPTYHMDMENMLPPKTQIIVLAYAS